MHIASLTLLCLTLAAVPAMAQLPVYDNGPVNGQTDAWTINLGFAVSDTFHLSSTALSLDGVDFWAWIEPGDTAISVEIAIGSTGYFSNDLFDETVLLTPSNCFSNNFGFDVCQEQSANFIGPALPAGNYYLTLENATTQEGNPLYWDENSGVGCHSPGCPSLAEDNGLGTVPSEAFTVNSYIETTTSSGTGTTPEPSGIMLFGAGLLAVARRLRGKLF